MARYIALLRGVNVGGNNKIAMRELKAVFERQGFENVVTYINSGNILFDSDLDEAAVKSACEELIMTEFGLNIFVGIVAATELADAINHAPDWWDSMPDSKHNAIFVIPPMTAAEVCALVGETKPEYEKTAYYGKVIFWSAPLATFSRTRWSKIVQNKAAYNAITIRNANTAKKLAELAKNELGEAFCMDSFTKEDLQEALRAITSTLGKCEKAQLKLREGTPQFSLTRNRINAFHIAVTLINEKLEEM